jgi:hypothetical protein
VRHDIFKLETFWLLVCLLLLADPVSMLRYSKMRQGLINSRFGCSGRWWRKRLNVIGQCTFVNMDVSGWQALHWAKFAVTRDRCSPCQCDDNPGALFCSDGLPVDCASPIGQCPFVCRMQKNCGADTTQPNARHPFPGLDLLVGASLNLVVSCATTLGKLLENML